VRYTDDDKDLTVAAAPVNNVSISDDHVSWDVSAMYDVTQDFSVYRARRRWLSRPVHPGP
jgi:iron complex outermembrane receptor protein